MSMGFFSMYKFYVLVALIVLVVVTALLIFFSMGPQTGGFDYQIF